ncbi:DMT family transporter [Pseudomarimonas arenosa]|uniref:EamA family transporter n=1 Tax=Pseudomarimonas arenosa TaxID=2774145 RepID=A0AAW3ZSU8_9GAMM|nr:EamA family transporter [Pseudomarimonas arenosa]MBD8528084.1 EamA family transporter [Pseudomarimonas arenosa]
MSAVDPPSPPLSGRSTALLAFIGMTLIWGSTWYAIRLQLNGTPPFLSVALRSLLAAAIMALWILLSRRSFGLDRRLWALVPVQGATLYGINYLFAYASTQYVVSGVVALLFAVNVVVTLLLEPWMLERRSPPQAWWAALLGLLGLGLVLSPGWQVQDPRNWLWGAGLALAGAVTVGLGAVLSSRLMAKGAPLLTLNFYGFVTGALIAGLASLSGGEVWRVELSAAYTLSMVYLAIVGSVIAFALYMRVVQDLGPVRAGYSSVITPVIALLLSALWEGLRPTLPLLLGVALVLAGNLLIMSSRANAGRA